MSKLIIFDWIGTLYEKNRGVFPESQRVLEELEKRGYHMGLISLGKDISSRTNEIFSSGLDQYLNPIIVQKEKTPIMYQECMQKMRALPSTTTIIDDRTLRGIKIGNSLGYNTIWIQKGEFAHEVPNEESGEPTHIVNNLSDVLNYL